MSDGPAPACALAPPVRPPEHRRSLSAVQKDDLLSTVSGREGAHGLPLRLPIGLYLFVPDPMEPPPMLSRSSQPPRSESFSAHVAARGVPPPNQPGASSVL